MTTQKSAFLDHIGNSWYDHNKDDPVVDQAFVLPFLKHFPFIQPRAIIEVGCADGRRLRQLHKAYPSSKIRGLEPSAKAVAAGNKAAGVDFIDIGTADKLPYPDSCTDLLIYGYCLGYVDPMDYFKIVTEGDRVLVDEGWLVIVDSNNIATGIQKPEYSKFAHYPCWWFRYDYRQLWVAHPAYKVHAIRADTKRSVVLLHKSFANAFAPSEPLSTELSQLINS